MLNQLSRPEEVNIKNDIHEVARSLATIASSMTNTTTAKTERVVENGDPFFGKLHMSGAHMDAWERDFNSDYVMLVGLMEECAELQQAASKYYRTYRDTDHRHCVAERASMIEEMAHVLIDIRMVCNSLSLGITPGEIQQEIYKKCPDGYNVRAVADDGEIHYEERTGESERS